MKAYKLLRIKKDGKLYPLYVDTNTPTPIGEWIEAKCGEMTDNGKVKSALGPLCFRPGFHLSDLPYASHIGRKGDSGEIEFMNENHVWCECEYAADIDYQPLVNENGKNKHGIIIPKNAYMKEIPVNGYYRYKTNPNMYGDWIITGAMKLIRIISDKEVAEILINNGIKPMPRYGGEMNLEKYGLKLAC